MNFRHIVFLKVLFRYILSKKKGCYQIKNPKIGDCNTDSESGDERDDDKRTEEEVVEVLGVH